MKKFIISLLIVAAFVAIPVSVFAQSGTTEETSSYANVIEALSLAPAATGLDFGTFTPGNNGGSVVMTPTSATASGNRTQTGTVDLITGTTTPTCALYTMSGTADAEFTVTIPSSTVDLTHKVTPAHKMSLGTFTIFLDALGNNTSVLSGTGTSAFAVGGTLTVAAAQASGSYEGSFNVTVAYN